MFTCTLYEFRRHTAQIYVKIKESKSDKSRTVQFTRAQPQTHAHVKLTRYTAVKISVLCVISAFERSVAYTRKPCCDREIARCRCKLRYVYQNLQRHRAVLPVKARHLVFMLYIIREIKLASNR